MGKRTTEYKPSNVLVMRVEGGLGRKVLCEKGIGWQGVHVLCNKGASSTYTCQRQPELKVQGVVKGVKQPLVTSPQPTSRWCVGIQDLLPLTQTGGLGCLGFGHRLPSCR